VQSPQPARRTAITVCVDHENPPRVFLQNSSSPKESDDREALLHFRILDKSTWIEPRNLSVGQIDRNSPGGVQLETFNPIDHSSVGVEEKEAMLNLGRNDGTIESGSKVDPTAGSPHLFHLGDPGIFFEESTQISLPVGTSQGDLLWNPIEFCDLPLEIGGNPGGKDPGRKPPGALSHDQTLGDLSLHPHRDRNEAESDDHR